MGQEEQWDVSNFGSAGVFEDKCQILGCEQIRGISVDCPECENFCSMCGLVLSDTGVRKRGRTVLWSGHFYHVGCRFVAHFFWYVSEYSWTKCKFFLPKNNHVTSPFQGQKFNGKCLEYSLKILWNEEEYDSMPIFLEARLLPGNKFWLLWQFQWKERPACLYNVSPQSHSGQCMDLESCWPHGHESLLQGSVQTYQRKTQVGLFGCWTEVDTIFLENALARRFFSVKKYMFTLVVKFNQNMHQ